MIKTDPGFLSPSLPRLSRGYSASVSRRSSYEHIIVSNPKPGVGLGIHPAVLFDCKVH